MYEIRRFFRNLPKRIGEAIDLARSQNVFRLIVGGKFIAFKMCRDLAARLVAQKRFPTVWLAIGISGQKMAREVGSHLPAAYQKILHVFPTFCDRENASKITISDSPDDPIDKIKFPSVKVLLIDSAIHSGQTMLRLAEHARELGAKDVISYSLILKRGASFVPNFFGVIVSDTDRAYFQLKMIPNNRLISKRPAFGHLRTINETDYLLPLIRSGVASIDAGSFGDMYYETKAKGAYVYLYVKNKEVCGYVSFEKHDNTLMINAIVSSLKSRGEGVGGALMRWAETWARSGRLSAIELWAIENQISFYEGMGYEKVVGVESITVNEKEKYTNMRKKILYNVNIEDMD